jgi:hypothetical protein
MQAGKRRKNRDSAYASMMTRLYMSKNKTDWKALFLFAPFAAITLIGFFVLRGSPEFQTTYPNYAVYSLAFVG